MGSSSSTLEFRQQINLLSTTTVSPNNHEFWKVIFLASITREETFAMVQPRDIRYLRDNNPQNLATLLFKLIEQLYTYVKHSSTVNDTQSVKVSLWILTRALPFIFESPENPFMESFFFKCLTCNRDVPEERFGGIGADDLSSDDTLASILQRTLIKLCFITGFTIGPCADVRKASWYNSPEPEQYPIVTASTTAILENRFDVLQCILVSMSSSMYNADPLAPNAFMKEITTNNKELSKQLCWNLLSVVLALNPRGSIPYSTSLLSDPVSRIADLALHVLIVSCDYSEATMHAGNEFWACLCSLEGAKCERLLVQISNLLRVPLDASNTYLPGSQLPINYTRELLVLLWKIVERNHTARAQLARSKAMPDAILAVLATMVDVRFDAARYGEMQTCTFLLLSLSGERDFCVQAGTYQTPKYRMNLPVLVEGTLADLISVAIHALMTHNKPWLKPFVDCWLTVLTNMSPYFKQLSMVAAAKIVSLFDFCTFPSYLKKDSKAIVHAGLIVEAMCNAVQYQYDSCVTLVYALLRSPEGLTRLNEYTHPHEHATLPEGWTKQLQGLLNTLIRLCNALRDQVNALVITTDKDLLDFLLKTTVVGLLPVPHPILIRRFESQTSTQAWLAAWTWGLVFMRNLSAPLFDAGTIRLFQVTATEHMPPAQHEQTTKQTEQTAPPPAPGSDSEQRQPVGATPSASASTS